MEESRIDELAGELQILLGEPVELSEVTQQSLGETVVSLAVINGWQRVLLLSDPTLELPEFLVEPGNGLKGSRNTDESDSSGVSFESDFKALRSYRVWGLTDQEFDALFGSEIIEWFDSTPGWRLRGDGCLIAVLRKLEQGDDRGMGWFAGVALPLVQLFQQSSARLSRLNAEHFPAADCLSTGAVPVSGADVTAVATSARLRVSVAELESFVASPVPRRPTSGMIRQVVGDVMIISMVGFVFLLIGVAMMYASQRNDGQNGPPVLLGFLFAFSGGLTVALIRRFRRGKMRILTSGDLVVGRIVSVTTTNVEINDQPRYHVGVRYAIDGQEYLSRINAYGAVVERAQYLKRTQPEVRLLSDPSERERTICLDLLEVCE